MLVNNGIPMVFLLASKYWCGPLSLALKLPFVYPVYHLQRQLIRLQANHHFLILSKVGYSFFFLHSHMCIPAIPSHQLDEPNEPASPPPRPAGLRQTASFYTPLDGYQLGCGHSVLAIPDPDDFGHLGNDTIEEPVIDENSPSEDERFAEAVLRGI